MSGLARLLLVPLAWLLLGAADPSAPATAEGLLAGRVLRVIDGDTVDVRLASGRVRVRLHGIDAPERDQPGGEQATRWLAEAVQDRDVLLEPVSQDQYERLLAIVHLEGRDMNRALVEAGHAWAYRRYLRRADRALCTLEAEARAARRGVWARESPRAPWQHRATRGRGPFTDFSAQTARDCWRQRG